MSNQALKLATPNKLSIAFSAADSSYAEVKDSIIDAFRAGRIMEETLKDGFQFRMDEILKLLQTEPLLREIVNDWPVFLSEFLKLNAQTAQLAVLEAKRVLEAEKPLGKAGSFIFGVLYNLASSYGFITTTASGFQIQKAQWEVLFAGQSPIPNV